MAHRARHARRERRRRTRERLEDRRVGGPMLLAGLSGLLIGVVVGVLGGSATVAWWVGLVGACLAACGLVAVTGAASLARHVRRRARAALVAVALALALGGGIAYVLWPGDVAWWLASAASVPLSLLPLLWEREREEEGGHGEFVDFGGPWAPP